MPHRAEQFAKDWLALREPVDHAARSSELAREAAEWLKSRSALRVVDLGAGSGSNMRWLAPRLPQAQQWTLLDHDASLLEAAEQSPRPVDGNGCPIGVRTIRVDLAELPSSLLSGADLVTASALFDLVSRPWLEQLAQRLASSNAAALFALTVDGRRWFIDADDQRLENGFDRRMERLFNDHQRRPKGLGEALGATAARALPAVLTSAGLQVQVKRTDWRLTAGQPETGPLGAALLSDWAGAASEQSPAEADRIDEWCHRRRIELEAGSIGIVVSHADVLALPQHHA